MIGKKFQDMSSGAAQKDASVLGLEGLNEILLLGFAGSVSWPFCVWVVPLEQRAGRESSGAGHVQVTRGSRITRAPPTSI